MPGTQELQDRIHTAISYITHRDIYCSSTSSARSRLKSDPQQAHRADKGSKNLVIGGVQYHLAKDSNRRKDKPAFTSSYVVDMHFDAQKNRQYIVERKSGCQSREGLFNAQFVT